VKGEGPSLKGKGGSRIYVEGKLRRVLEGMHVDFAEFRSRYQAEPGRRGPGPRPPTKEQIAAVDAYRKNSEFEALKKALGTKHSQVAHAIIGRVISFENNQKMLARAARRS